MWDDIARRWLDLLFWWRPRRRDGTPPEEARGRAPGAGGPGAGPDEGVEQQVETAEKVGPDDLTVLKGIGPVVQDRLRGLGIATFGDLAAADPDALAERLKGAHPVSKARVRGWTEAARERTRPRG